MPNPIHEELPQSELDLSPLRPTSPIRYSSSVLLSLNRHSSLAFEDLAIDPAIAQARRDPEASIIPSTCIAFSTPFFMPDQEIPASFSQAYPNATQTLPNHNFARLTHFASTPLFAPAFYTYRPFAPSPLPHENGFETHPLQSPHSPLRREGLFRPTIESFSGITLTSFQREEPASIRITSLAPITLAPAEISNNVSISRVI